ncbi:MAG: SHOCT domain-containing protein [Lachnospiraceae bacterium]|nr:SHOCT domain-containing protein [Lachnospiraceae bacterium]
MASAPAAETNVVEELKKYKELLDMGIITEEEFTAKKRQLMDI